MRTRETILAAISLLCLAPAALAQEQDPTVNESDFDTRAPPSDESYLDEAEAEAEPDPTLAEGDFDMSAPPYDASYLDEAEGSGAADATGAADGASDRGVPAPGLLAGLALVGLAALGLRRATRNG